MLVMFMQIFYPTYKLLSLHIVSGKWDCFVSGGLAVGFGILETAIKEVAEEASVVGELVKKLVPAGCVRCVKKMKHLIYIYYKLKRNSSY